VINAIQRAIGERVEFQAMVDAVGDQLRGVFGSENLWIRLRDADGVTIRILYLVEHGVRHPPRKFTRQGVERRFGKELRAGRTLVVNDFAEQEALQILIAPGTERPLSGVYVPIVVGERHIGELGLESFERESAFDEAAVRLLQTVTGSMGAALENARLFDEIQRLLKETERRNAELAVISGIQQGLVA
jgi:GAF domain-containing protein